MYKVLFLVLISNMALAQNKIFQSQNRAFNGASQTAPSYGITDGLILNLDAGETASYSGTGTIWNDISGNNNNGTLNGAVFTTTNGVSYFNFSNTYVNTSITKSNTMTFSVWARTSSNPEGMLFNTGNTGVGGGPNLFFYQSGLHWNTWDSGSNSFGVLEPIDANWHNYTVVNDATSNKATLYIDGVLVGNQVTYKSSTYTTNLYIGAAGLGDGYFWNGDIAIFQAYNRALNSSEILQNYNAIKGRYGL